MQEHDMSWVRTEMALAQAAPRSEIGPGAWLRKNLFASASDTVLTILGLALVVLVVPPLVDWAFVQAQWVGTGREFCATVAQGGMQPDGWCGACSAFVRAWFSLIMVARYPVEAH